MTFNEKNTIETALIEMLKSADQSIKPSTGFPTEMMEYTVPYIYHHSTYPKWKYVHGEELVLYGKQPQDVFVDTWLKAALCRLNHPLTENSDLADEIIHRLRGVLLEANYSGLIRANEIFQEWLTGRVSMPLGKDGEHITINLIDFNQYERNQYVVSQQVQFTGTRDCFFDLVLFINGLPIVVGEVKTPVRNAISWQDGAADFLGGQKHYWENQKSFFVPNLLCFASEGKTFYYGAIGARFKNWAPWHSTEDRDSIPQNISNSRRTFRGKNAVGASQCFFLWVDRHPNFRA